ncbi:hypothetical protein D3C76_1613840 [compost metagenome]
MLYSLSKISLFSEPITIPNSLLEIRDNVLSNISFVDNILTKFLALSTSENSGNSNIDSTLVFIFLLSFPISYLILSHISPSIIENVLSSLEITVPKA